MRSLVVAFLAICCCFLASGNAQAQTPAAKFQALVTSGNQAAAVKNYPLAISCFQQALRIMANQQVTLLLQQTMQAYQLAQNAYTTNLNAGRVALGKSDFQTATAAFNAAGAALPSDASTIATAQRFLTGTTAIQTAFTNISNGDFTDALTNYNNASRLVGSDQYAKTPLNQIRLAITENRNPAPYYAQNMSAGVSNMLNGRFAQAQANFKTAASLPVGLAEQSKAQNYYNAATALVTAYADIALKSPNYVDAVAQYQSAVTSLAGDANVQASLNRLLTTLGNGLNTEIGKGNQYLNVNDLDNAFLVANNVSTLVTLFPKSTAAQTFLTRFQNQASLGLAQALNNGSINPATFTATGSTPASISINFQSTKLYIWYLKIPMGTMFGAANLGINATGTQTMIVTADTNFQVKPNSTNNVQVAAVSLDPTNSTPSAQNPLVLSAAVPSKNVQAILKSLQVAQPGPRVTQFAIWIVVNPALKSTDISVGSVGPTAQEIVTLQTIFTNAGLNPQVYPALQ